MAVSARLVSAASLFVCLCWSAFSIVGDGELLVVAVACMCASLVSSFGLVLLHLALSVPRRVGVIRTIHVGPTGPMGHVEPVGATEAGSMRPQGQIGPGISQALFRRATVFDDSHVAIAVESSPTAASPKVWVFEPSSPYD
jgi:hypothetical protein